MADDIDQDGRTLVRDLDGRRLLITSTTLLNLPGDEVILVYEGRGTIFFQIDRPMNRYRLLASGFPEKAADSVSDMVNRLISILAERRRVEAAKPALEGTGK
jgi:hypothetical protein